MKIFDVIITPDMIIKGVKAISLVEEPAIDSDFLALKSEEMIQLAEVDKDQRILLGAVLIPDKPILRRRNEETFYIRFSKETIQKAQEYFFSNGFQNSTTIEHNGEDVQGNTVVESWIKEDEDKDKSNLYNLNAPVGSWLIKMKINNQDVWDDYVKTGKVKGFSIEGFFKPVEMTSMSNEMTGEDKVEQIRKILFDE